MTRRLVLLGDSLAYGTGAAQPADALAPRLVSALADAGRPFGCDVLAVPGAVAADLRPQVERARGVGPELAVIIIGANDLLRFTPPDASAAALGEAVGTLTAAGTKVLVVTAPDLSVVSRIPPEWRTSAKALCALLESLQVDATTAAGGVAVRLGSELAPRFVDQPQLLSTDRFHPSSAGYAVIAEALAPHVVALAGE